MSDDVPSKDLTDYALPRLRSLAKGNGVEPEQIVLMSGEEKVYRLKGIVTLEPLCDTDSKHYVGTPRGKNVQILPTIAALREEVDKRKKAFQSTANWIEAARTELRKESAEGWGLDGARIELPSRSVTLAARESCKTCQGSKNISCGRCQGRGYEVCVQCRGTRQEICYNCHGSGQNQQTPGQPCPICNGTRNIPCRFCHARGQTPCPVCQSRGGTPCPTCRGTGSITEEVRITCGATTRFHIKTEGLPSGLRRGLDRLGIVNLAKGHATIISVEPKPDETSDKDDDFAKIPGGLYGVAPTLPQTTAPSASYDDEDDQKNLSSHEPKASSPELHYEAQLPFADLRIDFAGKKAEIGVFGLRKVFLDVPPFLDASLAPWREKLKRAARDQAAANDALQARALREALDLNLQGRGSIKELRRIYPVGLTPAVAEEILFGTKQIIKRLTLRTRSLAAIGAGIISAAIFAVCYFTQLATSLVQMPALQAYEAGKLLLYFVPLLIATGLSFGILTGATRYELRKHFPEVKTPIKQSTGKTTYMMLIGIILVWIALLAASPMKPIWLAFWGSLK